MRILTNAPARLLLLAAVACLGAAAAARAQAPKEAPAAVEGRVTDGEKGLPGVTVVLLDAQPADGPTRPRARAKTDHEGRYRLSGAPPGSYFVLPVAPVFVTDSGQALQPGRRFTLAAGETASGVDFRLTRGGVITGRVTDADNQPVIGEVVLVTAADGSQQNMPNILPQRNRTDDRGVYRIFGLPPGRYLVSAGQQDQEGGDFQMNGPGRSYRRTYHPAAFEKSQARVVEVTAGGETADVDITLGRATKTYRASGRVAGTDGRPAPGVWVGYGLLDREGRGITAFGSGGPTNARGEFEVVGLVPGRYAVFAAHLGDTPSETYSDPSVFEVDGADVSGLEVKMRAGASVSGVVQVEGTNDPAKAARLLQRVRIMAHVETSASNAPGIPNYAHAVPGADGSFRLSGLRPGKVHLGLGWSTQTPALTLSRVEINGVSQGDGFELAEGAQLGGVRVVVIYGESVVRGQVNVVGGTLAPDARVYVFARRPGAGEEEQHGPYGKGAEADARGRFVIEGLAAGSYELGARIFSPHAGRQQSQRVPVVVTEGGEATATITLDLGAK